MRLRCAPPGAGALTYAGRGRGAARRGRTAALARARRRSSCARPILA